MSIGFHPATNERGKRWFLFLSFVLLTLISGIRGYTVGADTKVYIRWYESIDHIAINNGRFEAGFTIFMKMRQDNDQMESNELKKKSPLQTHRVHSGRVSRWYFKFLTGIDCIGS